jgi:hypothetical protein
MAGPRHKAGETDVGGGGDGPHHPVPLLPSLPLHSPDSFRGERVPLDRTGKSMRDRPCDPGRLPRNESGEWEWEAERTP